MKNGGHDKAAPTLRGFSILPVNPVNPVKKFGSSCRRAHMGVEAVKAEAV
jgi:hypothetical protein